MKNGTLYAKRVKKYYKKLLQDSDLKPAEGFTDPVQQLIIAQLTWDATTSNAERAARDLTDQMIDYNEVRVSTVREIAAVIRPHVPNPMECARNISRSLNAVFLRENAVALEHLRGKGRREARQYLDSLEGVNHHTAASVMLWSLGGHGVPVNQRLLRALRKEDLVDPDADAADVQAFLERNIPAAEARQFCAVMEKLAGQKGTPSTARSSSRSKKTAARKKTTRKSGSTRSGKKAERRKTA